MLNAAFAIHKIVSTRKSYFCIKIIIGSNKRSFKLCNKTQRKILLEHFTCPWNRLCLLFIKSDVVELSETGSNLVIFIHVIWGSESLALDLLLSSAKFFISTIYPLQLTLHKIIFKPKNSPLMIPNKILHNLNY